MDERKLGRKIRWVWRAAVAACAALGLAALAAGPKADAPKQGNEELLKRGEYLINAFACNDCHTPWKMGPKGPEPDMSRFLSGHPADLNVPPAPALGNGGWMWAGSATNTAFAGPWGISFAINLTPDSETGIGKWPAEYFIHAMRTGKHLGVGRPLMPPMPWQGLGRLTDEDLTAMFTYLKSLKPIRNQVPPPVFPEVPAKKP
jgi:mono/diheme cytochrome c family protein